MTIWNTLEEASVTAQKVDGGTYGVLCKSENSQVNVHLSGGCGRIVAEAKTGLMKTYE